MSGANGDNSLEEDKTTHLSVLTDAYRVFFAHLHDIASDRGSPDRWETRREEVEYKIRNILLLGSLLSSFAFVMLAYRLIGSEIGLQLKPTLLDALWIVPLAIGMFLWWSVKDTDPEKF